MFSNINKLETMTEQRRTCIGLLLKLLNRIYETRFCNDKLLGWTRNVGGLLFATRRYDIVTRHTVVSTVIYNYFTYTCGFNDYSYNVFSTQVKSLDPNYKALQGTLRSGEDTRVFNLLLAAANFEHCFFSGSIFSDSILSGGIHFCIPTVVFPAPQNFIGWIDTDSDT